MQRGPLRGEAKPLFYLCRPGPAQGGVTLLREWCSLDYVVPWPSLPPSGLPFPAFLILSCCFMKIFIYLHQPLPASVSVEFAVAATDCIAKDVVDPTKCNLLAEKVSRPGKAGHGTEHS